MTAAGATKERMEKTFEIFMVDDDVNIKVAARLWYRYFSYYVGFEMSYSYTTKKVGAVRTTSLFFW